MPVSGSQGWDDEVIYFKSIFLESESKKMRAHNCMEIQKGRKLCTLKFNWSIRYEQHSSFDFVSKVIMIYEPYCLIFHGSLSPSSINFFPCLLPKQIKITNKTKLKL